MSENNGAQSANGHHNISEQERNASLLAGGGLALAGLQQCLKGRLPAALGLFALGGALLYRGKTQHCPLYEAAGVNTAPDEEQSSQAQPAGEPVKAPPEKVEISQVMTINKPAQELYAFWRRGEGLAQLSPLLQSVHAIDAIHWEWTANAPGGDTLQWDTEIVEDKPGKIIRWQSHSDSYSHSMPAPHNGSITFHELAHDRGTETTLKINYNPPGSLLGAALARLFGAVPDQFALEMLRRFKQLMEAGELAQAQNQPAGAKSTDASNAAHSEAKQEDS